jgi:hypothetical protein
MKKIGLAAANSGALSIDQAVARLGDQAKKKDTEDAEETAPAEDVPGSRRYDADARDAAPLRAEEPEALRRAQDEDSEEDGDSEADGEESEDAELEPPKFWDAKAKERFGDLPRDLQKIVLDKEAERNQATAKALQESAEHRKTADAEAARFKTVADGLARLLPEAADSFENRWSNVDWKKVAQSHGAEQTLKLQAQMQAEQRNLQRLNAAKEWADRLSHARFVQEQEQLVPELAPDLADQKQGRARREELGRFLLGLGIQANRIPHLSALEAGLAYDAMQWRNGKAKADALVAAPRESAPQKRTPAKPGGTASRGSAQQNRIAALSHKKELTIDEAVELHNLKGTQ